MSTDSKASARPTKASSPTSPLRVIAVTSGKGGVGKTNVVTNLALALSRAGKRVLVWDADLGLANIDVLLGLKPEYNINHMLSGEKSLREILVTGPGGFRIMPASSGIQELSDLGEGQKVRLLSELDEFEDDLDFLLIDTGAGISSNVTYFNMAAQERILVVTPEPTSITDAYAMIKVMATKYNQKSFNILPNMVSGVKEAKSVYTLLAGVADKHIGHLSLGYIGYVVKDEHLVKSVRQQRAVLDLFPQSQAGGCFIDLAKRLINSPTTTRLDGNIRFFWKRLLRV